jgi:hypothetical protein
VTTDVEPNIYGIVAEFLGPDELLAATQQAREAGYSELDAYAPYPVHGLAEALDFHNTRIPLTVLAGGALGFAVGYGLQYWVSVIDYPLNVGGKPYHSWPAFIPVSFELTVLFAAVAAVLGMLAWNGLPMPYHPLFNVPSFSLASQDRFFLCIESDDPQFDHAEVREFLKRLDPLEVSDVPW